MRVRRFAALLLLPLAVAACGRDPVDANDSALFGSWFSDPAQIVARAPNGSADVRSVIAWSFRRDGSFVQTNYVVDAQTNTWWVMSRQAGSWRTSGEELVATIRARFTASPELAVDNPPLDPVEPIVERFTFRLDNSATLLITPPCPANASCVPAPVLHLFESFPE